MMMPDLCARKSGDFRESEKLHGKTTCEYQKMKLPRRVIPPGELLRVEKEKILGGMRPLGMEKIRAQGIGMVIVTDGIRSETVNVYSSRPVFSQETSTSFGERWC